MSDTVSRRAAAPAGGYATTGFLLRAAVYFVLFFGLSRVAWVQQHVLVPYAGLLEMCAAGIAGKAQLGVAVDQSCTGSDAMALCLSAVLAFPATWRQRLAGGALGLGLIAVANTARIGTLAAVVGDRALFNLLHLQVWPAVLIVLTAGFVFLWMRRVTAPVDGPAAAAARGSFAATPIWRFLALTLVLVIAYYALQSRLLESAWLLGLARLAAATAGALMAAVGATATVTDSVLRTSHGAWIVTPECVLTPLIPVYLAAVLGLPLAWRWRLAGVLAAPLLFGLLGTGRLLVLALPRAVVGSHYIAIHAFYQLLIAVALVAWCAYRAASDGAVGGTAARASRALGLGALAGLLVGLLDTGLLRSLVESLPAGWHLGHGFIDDQGVLVFLPAFQLGLLVALAWALDIRRPGRRGIWGLVLLAVLALASRGLLGEIAVHLGIEPPPVLIRVWALAAPLLAVWWIGGASRPRGAHQPTGVRVARAG